MAEFDPATDPGGDIDLSLPDDPLERLKAKKRGAQKPQAVVAESAATSDPLARLKARRNAQQPTDDTDGAREGVLDRGLDMLTGGLHPKIQGVGTAIGDVLTHGTNAHPVQSYEAGKQATRQRMQSAKRTYPTASTAADATGTFGGIALGGTLAQMLGLAEVPQAASAVQRIKDAGRVGFGVGAVGSGLASDGNLSSRLVQTGVGGVAGGAIGLGTAGAAEATRAGRGVLSNLLAPAEQQGDKLANEQLAQRLASDKITPRDLPRRAADAVQAGNDRAVLAHVAGPSMDPLTYVASSNPSPEGVALQQTLTNAQRGERGVLQHGVTAISGRENLPKNRAVDFLNDLEARRVVSGAEDYPKAYAEPPIDDPRILDAIANEPYLSGSLDKSVDILNRKSRATALRTGEPAEPVLNPLTDAPQQSGVDAQLASLYSHDPIKLAIARQKAGLPPEPVSGSGAIPVQMLDKLQQAAQPGIERGLNQGHLAAEDAGAINSQIQSILRMADESRPAFKDARARQAQYFGRIEGAQAGQKALQKTGPEIAGQLAELNRPGQGEAYRTTATSALRDLIDTKGYDANVGRSIFDNPEREAQLDALFGPGSRERLQPALDQSGILNRVLRASAASGSQTDPRRVAREALAPDALADEVTKVFKSPKRAIYNIPGRMLDLRTKAVQDAAVRSAAQKLGIPATSPELSILAQYLESPNEVNMPQFSNPGARGGLLGQFLANQVAGQ